MSRARTHSEEVMAGNAAPYVVDITMHHGGTLYALSSDGHIFERVPDPKSFNDGRGLTHFMWREIPGPIAVDAA